MGSRLALKLARLPRLASTQHGTRRRAPLVSPLTPQWLQHAGPAAQDPHPRPPQGWPHPLTSTVEPPLWRGCPPRRAPASTQENRTARLQASGGRADLTTGQGGAAAAPHAACARRASMCLGQRDRPLLPRRRSRRDRLLYEPPRAASSPGRRSVQGLLLPAAAARPPSAPPTPTDAGYDSAAVPSQRRRRLVEGDAARGQAPWCRPWKGRSLARAAPSLSCFPSPPFVCQTRHYTQRCAVKERTLLGVEWRVQGAPGRGARGAPSGGLAGLPAAAAAALRRSACRWAGSPWRWRAC